MCYMMIMMLYVKVPFHCVPFLHLGKPAAPGGGGGIKWQGDCQWGNAAINGLLHVVLRRNVDVKPYETNTLDEF